MLQQHLTNKIPGVSKFLVDQKAKVPAQVVTTNYFKSLLVQVGLEIACKVSIKVSSMVKNCMLIDKYIELVESLYSEPWKVIFEFQIDHVVVPAANFV